MIEERKAVNCVHNCILCGVCISKCPEKGDADTGGKMMRNKVITFCAAMGIPISSWGSTFGCTGICGSCQLSCLPGAAAVVILSVKIFSKKIAEKRRARYE